MNTKMNAKTNTNEHDIRESNDKHSTLCHSELTSFSGCEKLFLVVIFLVGLIARFYQLDVRGMHHDESLHLMYSFYILQDPEMGFYKYDPMLHGPLLYNIQAAIFQAFGVSFKTLRLLPAILGSLFIGAPLLFRSFLSKRAIIFATSFIAVSPSLVFWSRFLRHDYLVFLGMLISVYAVLLARPSYKCILFLLGFVIQFTAKENSYVTVTLLCGFLIYEILFSKIAGLKHDVLLLQTKKHIVLYWRQLLLGLLMFILLYAFLYTGGFRYTGDARGGLLERYFGAILDGVYRKSISYWLNQHEIVRLKGPFLYHLYLLTLCEVCFVLAYIAHLLLFFRRANPIIKLISLAFLLTYLGIAIFFFQDEVATSSLGNFFKLENHADLFGLFFLATHALLLTSDHLLKGQKGLAFWGYAFTSTFFTYSYLNEKVPWLSLYPLVFGLIYFVLYFDQYFSSKSDIADRISVEKLLYSLSTVLGLLGLIFILEKGTPTQSDYLLFYSGLVLAILSYLASRLKLLQQCSIFMVSLAVTLLLSSRSMILSNFVYPGHSNELLSQVHTTPEFDSINRRIRAEIESLKPGFKPTILATGEAVWPLTAYYRGLAEFSFYTVKGSNENYEYIIEDYLAGRVKTRAAYIQQKVAFRGWWIPDYTNASPKKLIKYIWNHTPWNPPGYAYIYFSTKKDFHENR